MYNPQIEWYSKQDVLTIFPITERTYFRKLKGITPDTRTKIVKNKKGRSSTLIYYQDLQNLFQIKRLPNNLDCPETMRRYVGTMNWDYVGNIVPSKSSKIEIIEKMKFVFDQIKSFDNKVVLFFNLEKNTKDTFYHCHFLIKSDLNKKKIYELLHLICDDKCDLGKRIDLKPYDHKTYQFRGSFYSFKFGLGDQKNNNPLVDFKLLI